MEQIISSTKNEAVKYIRSLKIKKNRTEHHAFLVEGEKCVRELLEHMPECVQSVFVLEGKFDDLYQSVKKMGKPVHFVKDNVMDAICECKTPQGVAAAAKMPEGQKVFSGFILMLDHVQDPQNVGTMIRTADAAGCSCVVLSEDSSDCYSPKAVRASMGSVFSHSADSRRPFKRYSSFARARVPCRQRTP